MSTADLTAGSSWLDAPTHREWLRRGMADVLGFAVPSIRAGGGFEWLDADGAPARGSPTPALPHRPDGVGVGGRGASRHPGVG